MNIKKKLSVLEKTQLWLVVQLFNKGVHVHENELNAFLNGNDKGMPKKAKWVRETSNEILSEEKNRIIKEIEEAFA